MTSEEQGDPVPSPVPAWLNAGRPVAKPFGRSTGEPSVAVLGGAMPPVGEIPVLTDVVATVPASYASDSSSAVVGGRTAPTVAPVTRGVSVSSFEEGWLFRGSATINGTCTIAGVYEGQILESNGGEASVVVSPTGVLTGDIRASNVSIMGRYSGTLDASGGRVELHTSSVISGHVRYGQLQVNGADLNATLERVPVRSK